MNKVILMGRLTREPEVRYSDGAEPLAVARYTLAVNRRFKKMRRTLFRALHLARRENLRRNTSRKGSWSALSGGYRCGAGTRTANGGGAQM